MTDLKALVQWLKNENIRYETIKELDGKILDVGMVRFKFDSSGKLVGLDEE